MARVIGELTGEGFLCVIREDDDGRCFWSADYDVDADGANGQNGKLAAYMVGNRGSELLGNGGMKMSGGRVIGGTSWFRDIVILGSDGQPKEFPGGIIASKTAYKFKDMAADDPAAYVDSETVSYIVVPPELIAGVSGVVKGCRARATFNGRRSDAIVGDVGPRRKSGEGSIQLARELRMNSSPRDGGVEEPRILFECWPGQRGTINGRELPLMRANGSYV